MITTKVDWFRCSECMPVDCKDILYCGYDGITHSGYFLRDRFIEPCDDTEALEWEPRLISMWTYFPRPKEIHPVVECCWRPYHYDDESSEDKPRNYQSVIFVSNTIGGKPAVYSGYYDESRKHFISYQEDFRFNGAEVQYWMPLPKPPGEN